MNGFIRSCKRCNLTYDWRRAPSSCLKMTYCGSLCEKADLGFTIEGMLRTQSGHTPETAEAQPRELVPA